MPRAGRRDNCFLDCSRRFAAPLSWSARPSRDKPGPRLGGYGIHTNSNSRYCSSSSVGPLSSPAARSGGRKIQALGKENPSLGEGKSKPGEGKSKLFPSANRAFSKGCAGPSRHFAILPLFLFRPSLAKSHGLRSYRRRAIGARGGSTVSVLVTIGLAIEATMAERAIFLETR